jgi:hypothetical protein
MNMPRPGSASPIVLMMLCLFANILAAALPARAENGQDIAAPKAAPDARSNSDFQQLLVNWERCFSKAEVTPLSAAIVLAACERASAYPDLPQGEQRRLAKRRQKLIEPSAMTNSEPHPETK